MVRNRGGRGLSYRPARLHRLAKIHSLESIPGPHTRIKIRALYVYIPTPKKDTWVEVGGGGGMGMK